MKVFRYEVLPGRDAKSLEMPARATILSVRSQGGAFQLWALVDPIAPLVRREYAFVGTGWDLPTPMSLLSPEFHAPRFVDTVQVSLPVGPLVFHFFDLGER